MQKQRQVMRKFTNEERFKIWDRMKSLKESGMSHHSRMLIQLKKEGFTMSDGSPLVSNIIARYYKELFAHAYVPGRRMSKLLGTPVETPSNVPLSLLTDPALTDTQKVRMLSAYYESAGA